MWPDDYIDWARAGRPLLLEGVRRWLTTVVGPRSFLRPEVAGLAEQAVKESFVLANEHRRHGRYFADEINFRRWLVEVANREAMRLLLRLEPVGPALNRLTPDQRRTLGMQYLDRLPVGGIAGLLGTTANEVAQHLFRALNDLRRILNRT